MSERILAPSVIETKQELLIALKSGQLKVSKYNLLTDNEKMFVELVAFGGYTGEQAIKAIVPEIKLPQLAANKMMANKEVADTLEELTMLKGRKFLAELASTRDVALSKLKYIMSTTKDDALAAACAKTILEKSVDIMKQADKKEDPVSHVRFNIQVENVYTGGKQGSKYDDEPIIIPLSEDDLRDLTDPNSEVVEPVRDAIKVKPTLNPSTGLPYTLSYEGVDAYSVESKRYGAEAPDDEWQDPSVNARIRERNSGK